MRFLISNDDGIDANGLAALEAAARRFGDVVVVAPHMERSSIGHAITLNDSVRLYRRDDTHYACTGTPTDAVYIALGHLMRDEPPTMLLSGINHGANLGDDVSYSGTVSAALEGALNGIPSVAFSLAKGRDYQATIPVVEKLLEQLLATDDLPVLLNINLPDCQVEPKGIRLGTLGRRHYGKHAEQRFDPRGRAYYWLGGSGLQKKNADPQSDEALIDQGYVTITPLTLDFSDPDGASRMRHWDWLAKDS